MSQEDEDEEFRFRLEVLRTQFSEGKIHIAEHLADDFKESLSSVKYDRSGKIDLETVDCRVRNLANLVTHLHNRNKMKDAASLEEISNSYFRYIEENLGFIVKRAREEGYDAHEL